ncbi:MAG: hypothetical protein IT461_05030 [Planctomycetes bacterium]|nr:hypothetical protein [Planctomycetota bacterium]
MSDDVEDLSVFDPIAERNRRAEQDLQAKEAAQQANPVALDPVAQAVKSVHRTLLIVIGVVVLGLVGAVSGVGYQQRRAYVDDAERAARTQRDEYSKRAQRYLDHARASKNPKAFALWCVYRESAGTYLLVINERKDPSFFLSGRWSVAEAKRDRTGQFEGMDWSAVSSELKVAAEAITQYDIHIGSLFSAEAEDELRAQRMACAWAEKALDGYTYARENDGTTK